MGIQAQKMRHLYFTSLSKDHKAKQVNTELVSLVIEHARNIIAHPTKPLIKTYVTFSKNPFGELELERSLDEAPFMDEADNLVVELQVEKPFSCVSMLDCSYSMTGEKHLLASIAVAVLLLEIPLEDSAVLAFGSEVSAVKRLGSVEDIRYILKRFLEHQSKGFTNIAEALRGGLKELSLKQKSKRKVGIIVTDGRSTEGGDPCEVAKSYDYLVVLHLEGPASSLQASQEIAMRGHGTCLQVKEFSQLPKRLYDALKIMSQL